MAVIYDWGSAGWKGVNDDATNRPGWEQPGYDDGAWPEVQLPLGNGGGGSAPCPIHSQYPRNTHWPIQTEYLLRRRFDGSVEVRFVVDNTVTIYWNGAVLFDGSGYLGDCPERDEHGPVFGTGAGVLALRCVDVSVESYADVRVAVTPAGFQIGRVGIGPGVGVR